MVLSKELTDRIKCVSSFEELRALCDENNIEMEDSDLQNYYRLYHGESVELEDDELDNVAGGACYSSTQDGPNGFHRYAVVTSLFCCNDHTALAVGRYTLSDSCYTCGHCFQNGKTHYCDKDWRN